RSNSRLNAARTVYDALKALSEHSSAASGFDLEDLWAPLSTALATRLEPGEPCPVCGSVHHADGAHGVAPATAVADLEAALKSAQAANLAAAEARAAAAEERARAYESRAPEARGQLDDLRDQLDTSTSRFTAAEGRRQLLVTKIEELEAEVGAVKKKVEDQAKLLKEQRSVLTDAKPMLERLDKDNQRLTRLLGDARARGRVNVEELLQRAQLLKRLERIAAATAGE
ncbi:MAG: hypothetical protein KIT58_23590, partial [Planctomycetota bacterium]|nr:hypothetical protein [Planctomycetota bacterium]